MISKMIALFSKQTIYSIVILALSLFLVACQSMHLNNANSVRSAQTTPVVITQLPGYQTPAVQSPYPQQPQLQNPSLNPSSNIDSSQIEQPIDGINQNLQQDSALVENDASNIEEIIPTSPLSRNDAIGVWKIITETETCTLSLALTQWTGGFRANTLQCIGQDIVDIKSWNIESGELIVKDAQGVPIASLTRRSTTRFEGTLPGSRRIVVLR